MPIFNINKGLLKEISESSISIEKDIQRLIERNMHTILGIEFITSKEFMRCQKMANLISCTAYDRL